MHIMTLLHKHTDYLIFAILGLMTFIMLWKSIERIWFYRSIKLAQYQKIEYLDIDLQKGLTPIYTIGSNAPYVGLLGTVIGILITFYDIGEQGGQINVAEIMIGLALALKATALGILLAIPSIVSYNLLSKKAEECRLTWQAEYQN